jgi:hypothetical protein
MIANGANTMDANIMDALPIKTITFIFFNLPQEIW